MKRFCMLRLLTAWLIISSFEHLSELRELFQDPLFADNFRILRTLVDSQIYRSYLTENFKRAPDFERKLEQNLIPVRTCQAEYGTLTGLFSFRFFRNIFHICYTSP